MPGAIASRAACSTSALRSPSTRITVRAGVMTPSASGPDASGDMCPGKYSGRTPSQPRHTHFENPCNVLRLHVYGIVVLPPSDVRNRTT